MLDNFRSRGERMAEENYLQVADPAAGGGAVAAEGEAAAPDQGAPQKIFDMLKVQQKFSSTTTAPRNIHV